MICFYLVCPFCSARVDLPDDEPNNLWKVVACPDCGRGFDYDPEDIRHDYDKL
jgi:hypothetical protein